MSMTKGGSHDHVNSDLQGRGVLALNNHRDQRSDRDHSPALNGGRRNLRALPGRVPTEGRDRDRFTWALIVALVAIAIAGIAYLLIPRHSTLFVAKFKNGLVTNEYAYFNPLSPLAVQSSQWVVTSGSLFGVNGIGWTGIPDGLNPDSHSQVATDSAVFRLYTRRSNFRNVAVSFRLRVIRYVTTKRTPAQTYDGVHVWLRYRNANELYFASVARRDGYLVIGKKLPHGATGGHAAGGGVYYHDVYVPGFPFPLGAWENIEVSIVTKGKQVIIRTFIDGQQVARLIDRSQPILSPGSVGIRGDNAEFEISRFVVKAV